MATYTLSLEKSQQGEVAKAEDKPFPGLQKIKGSDPEPKEKSVDEPVSSNVLWWIVGGMAVLTASLAVLFNS